MPTLVTGATEFIGSHVARKLVEKGERVRVLIRRTSKTPNIESTTEKTVDWYKENGYNR
jgi:nucleoside-diphosphate-sugar epimerase